MPDKSRISLFVDGVEHMGWTAMSIKRSLTSLCASFDLSLGYLWEQKPKNWKVKEGLSCVIKLDSHVCVTGYIESITQNLTSHSKTLRVCGRDITCDLVDSYYSGPKRIWNGASFKTILSDLISDFKAIKPHYYADVEVLLKAYSIQDEPIYTSLDRAAKMKGFLLYTDPKGELVVAKPTVSGSVQARLIEGKNVLSIESMSNVSGRFSDYQMQTFNFGASNKAIANITTLAHVSDDEILRKRVLLISPEGYLQHDANTELRLQWECDVREAKSKRLSVTVPTWTNDNHSLWRLNQLVYLGSPSFEIDKNFIVSGVSFSLDEYQGEIAQLDLEDPKAYKADPTIEVRENSFQNYLSQESKQGPAK